MEDAVLIDDQLWEQLLELTDGAASACFQCGVCTATCPWGLVKDESISIRELVRQAQIGLTDGDSDLWLCTTCAQCEIYCPRGVNIATVIRGLRYLTWQGNHPEEGLPTLLWSIYWNNNPWEQPPSQRAQWAKNIDLPRFDADQHEILYYVGCTTSYDGRAQKIAQALVKLFQAAEVQFGILGNDEPCSGEEALSIGHMPYFRDVAARALDTFKDNKVSQLVATSPHAFDVFSNQYPTDQHQIEPYHYTQYLSKLVEAGRLAFEKPLESVITFQDPCYLSRYNQVLDAPRKVLNAIPGLELVEMEKHGPETLCCGGGGGRMWIDSAAGERFADLRVQEALDTGAKTLATACPYCIACLEDSIKANNITNLIVADVAEIAAQALG
ncbi:(Fe-S)-binding protein [Chloroflexota bacterium]